MGTWGNLLSNMDHWSSNASQINFSFSNAEYVVMFQSNLQRCTQAAAGDPKLLFHLLRWSRPKGEYWSIRCFSFFLWCFKKRTRHRSFRESINQDFFLVKYNILPVLFEPSTTYHPQYSIMNTQVNPLSVPDYETFWVNCT